MPTVVLDLDGVIIKSNFVKHKAMLSLFDAHPRERNQISEFILASGGVRRDEKISHILKNILNIQAVEATLARHLSRYAEELEQSLATAQLVEGVEDFLATGGHSFYVCSSAPESELREQLARHNLASYFAAAYGAGTPKASALRQVSATHPETATVFFGDSVGDWEAAKEAKVAFVGVLSERDNFANLSITKLLNFASLASVHHAIQSAVLHDAI